jgi:2-polyprenyl-6-methoxyphenol hydroxylase-like FAD-dependent oxidoreductase
MQMFDRFGFVFSPHWETLLSVPSDWPRPFVAGLDRMVFDELLWRNAGRFPSVERREGFTVTDLLRDADGRVIGVVGSERDGIIERFEGRAVIGADGRFSLVARKLEAKVIEEEQRCVSTVYFAEWEQTAPFRPGLTCAHVHTTGRGLDVLCVPMPGDRLLINTHQRADRVDIQGDAQAYYDATIRSVPSVAKLLVGEARQVTELLGVKRVGNGYREPTGPGWALVGDAAHFKDPVDGQGIYDALLEARILAEALGRWLTAASSWEAAMADYARELHAATHPMYVETVGRLRRELYEEPPTFIIKTLIRWMMTDPQYQERFVNYLGRTISPKGWASPGLIGGAAMRGLWRDLSGRR